MTNIDFGTVTQAADFANAIELADKAGKRLLVERDNSNPGGETTYRLSAESKLSRYIRNVKAFFTGGASGYNHDRRVQLAFQTLLIKAADQQAGSTEADRLSLLDARIEQVDGRSISGSAANLFAQYIKESRLPFSSQQFDNATYDSLPLELAADYEVPIEELRGFPVTPDINDYEEIPGDESWSRSTASDDHDYDYISNNRSTLDLDSSHYETEPGYETQAGLFGQDNGGHENVSETPIEAQGHKSSVPRDYDYAKAEETGTHDDEITVPRLGRTQLRKTRPNESTFTDITSDPDFKKSTDAEFREALKFPKHTVTQALANGSTVSVAGTVPVPKGAEDYTAFHYVLAANTVSPNHINRLGILINADEFNERLTQALAHEDASSEGVAGASLKGTQAADILVAVKLLDELLYEIEQQYVQDLAKDQAKEAQYLKNLADEEFTPLNRDSLEADEEFTPLLRENRVRENGVAEDRVDEIPDVDDAVYTRLSDISTQ